MKTCLILLLCSAIMGQVNAKEFLIFDLIKAINKPDNLPLEPMHMIYQWAAYGGPYTSEKDKDYLNTIPEAYVKCCYVEHILPKNAPKYYSIDFEQWRLFNKSDQPNLRNLEYYKKTFKLFRDTLPKNAKISWYNSGALVNHRLFQNISDKMYKKWQKRNDILKTVVPMYDYMQPSLYFLENYNISMWRNKAKAFISEHRRLGGNKPVYAHLSPQYADKPNKLLPREIWKEMLKFSYENADGLIIWTFPQKIYQRKWDEHSEWWKETMLFIDKIKENK